MKRFLPIAVIAFLATLVATPVNAGYLIIRILFEGTPSPGLDNDAEPGAGMYGGRMPGSPGSPGGPSYGSGLGPPGGFGTGGGRPPMPGPGTTGGTTTPAPATETDPTRSIVVVIPVNSDLTKSERFDPARAMNESTNPMWKPVLTLVHRGQRIKTHLFADSVTVQWYENLLSTPAYRRTHDQDVQEKHWRWTKNRADTKLLYDTIRSAMEEGYVDLAMNFSDELLESVAGKESTLFPDVAAFVKAYKSLQGAIKKTPDTPNKASYWQQRLAARDVLTRGHYSLIYWDSPPEEVERRIALLEENFRAFYLLSALRGVELPVPDAPLIAVLPRNANQVVQVAAALDAPTTFRSDGAYSEEHDILVLSPERLDGIGQTFLRQVQQIYREGVSRDSLLVGKGPKIDAQEKDGGKKPDEVAWMQT
ncbi:MAG TPA: hypothetical protein VLM40_00475, partial [Gemmata sp.]|nr:hypothetical protein [Gemmata sp.]